MYICMDIHIKEQTGDSDKEAENSMIQMVHSLMVLTETHMSHKSISKEGGFKIAINGISIWKVGILCRIVHISKVF